MVYSSSTTKISTQLALIGGTTAQGTTAPGDNCTSQQFQVRFKWDKKQNCFISVSKMSQSCLFALKSPHKEGLLLL